MQVLNNAYQGVQNYCSEIPSNTPVQMAYASGAAFIITAILSGNLSQSAAAAGMSAVATAIHGLVTPFFKILTGGRTQLTWGEEMCRTFGAIIGARGLAMAFGDNTGLKDLTFLSLSYGFMIYTDPARRDLNYVDWIPVFPIIHIG